MSHDKNGLRFKAYNPEEIKKQLPDGFSPLESLPVSVDFSRNTTIKVHGFANAKEANDFLNSFAPQFIPSCKLTKGFYCNSPISFLFCVVVCVHSIQRRIKS